MAHFANRFGLSRDIPESVKREVRQRCGFGCVVCASAIYVYEHFSPEFKDARIHDAAGIALLCPTEHTKKASGLLSEEEYRERIRAPRALDVGFSATAWGSRPFAPEILFGSLTFVGGTSVVRVGQELLLGFTEPEEPGAPPGLSYRVFDRRGVEAFSIIGNEIRCQNDAFDVEAIGATWKVRSAIRQLDLELRFDPPTRITISRMHFRYLRWELIVNGPDFTLLFGGAPVQTIRGHAKVVGPCLYSLAEDRPNVASRDLTITFGAGPSPLGTEPLADGFRILWPLYVLVRPSDDRVYVTEFAKRRALPLYTRKSFAEAASADELEPRALDGVQCRDLVAEHGRRNACDIVVMNPHPTQPTNAWTWQNFISSIDSGAT